jgi:kinesin family protein 5
MAEAKRTSIFSVASLAGSPVKRPASLATREDPSRSAAKRATPPGAAAAAPKHQAPPHDERVRVFVRVRPNRPDETPGALALHPGGAALQARRDEFSAVDFSFDRVLGPSASQADCYQAAAAPIVADVLRGYNATLLAYGQTGSGKTHTLGSFRPDAVGMIPRACAQVFAALAAEPEGGHTVHLAYLQIYCEQIQDLLRPGSGDSLPIREGEGGVCVPGLRQEEVASLEDCLRLLQLGDRNRSVAFTALNACSSRSHAVVQLTVARRGGGGGAAAQRVRVGKLYMVDLAGSERLKKSRSTGALCAHSAARHSRQEAGKSPLHACPLTPGFLQPASCLTQASAPARPRPSTCRSRRWGCASTRAPTPPPPTSPSETPS